MPRIAMGKKVSPIIFILFISVLIMRCQNQSVHRETADVEKGLLPDVLIEGEPALDLKERMEYYHVPGVSIAVIKDFKTVWTRSYGVMDAETDHPVEPETKFNVGSLSKAVASLAALRLVDAGKIDLTGDVNNQLVSWKIPENEFTRQGTVTPLLLMNHSSGAMFYPGFAYERDNFPTLLQMLNGEKPSNYRAVQIDRIPGTEYNYSNAGYAILEQLIADVSGEPYPAYAEKNIFKVLNMQNSTLFQPLSETALKTTAAGHDVDGKPFPAKQYYIQPAAAGGLWTTAADYAKFVIELQKAYAGTSNRIISAALAKEMMSPHVSKQYGLGVFMREIDGELNYVGHMGDGRGFFAGFISHLRDGYGAVVLTNSKNGARLIREITNGIARIYGWEKYLPEKYKQVPVSETMTDQFQGRYAIGSDESFEVKKENGQLFLDRFDTAKLFHVGDGKFVTPFRLGYLTFESGSDPDKISAEYFFADELGRFITGPRKGRKMHKDEKLPIDFLHSGQIKEALKLYKKIRQKNPSDFYVSENRLNSLGYEFLGKGKTEEAIALFLLNTEFNPGSSNCFDSLAEAYMRKGDNGLAKINYKKSLALDPANQNAALMLKKL